MKSKSYPPKDGGWGWAVVFGVTMFAFLTRGFLRSFSLVFEEMRRKFGTSASSTAWVYSVMVTTSMFAGKKLIADNFVLAVFLLFEFPLFNSNLMSRVANLVQMKEVRGNRQL